MFFLEKRAEINRLQIVAKLCQFENIRIGNVSLCLLIREREQISMGLNIGCTHNILNGLDHTPE